MVGSAAGGITGPLLFSKLLGTGKAGDPVIAFVVGAAPMILAGPVEVVLDEAERQSLKDPPAPLSATGQSGPGAAPSAPHLRRPAAPRPATAWHAGRLPGTTAGRGRAMEVNASVIYYSATGTTYQMAMAAAEAAEKAGADVRLRKVRELAPDEAVASNEGWAAHQMATQDIPEATLDDLDWANAVIFGTPTRFGNVSAQLKQFIDTAGPLWAQGKLTNKVFSGFVSTATAHGGQESTLLTLFNVAYHWGGIVVTPGYTEPGQFVSGNPYGGSHTSNNGDVPPDQNALAATALTATRAVNVARALTRGLV